MATPLQGGESASGFRSGPVQDFEQYTNWVAIYSSGAWNEKAARPQRYPRSDRERL